MLRELLHNIRHLWKRILTWLEAFAFGIFFISWILLTIALFFSCGTKKMHSEMQEEHNTDIQFNDSSVLNIDKVSFLHYIQSGQLNAEIRIRKFSDPDSTGRQHVEEETNINLNNDTQTDISKVDSTKATGTKISNVVRNTSTKKHFVSDTKKDNRPFPNWVWWIVGIGLLAGAALWVKKKFFVK